MTGGGGRSVVLYGPWDWKKVLSVRVGAGGQEGGDCVGAHMQT